MYITVKEVRDAGLGVALDTVVTQARFDAWMWREEWKTRVLPRVVCAAVEALKPRYLRAPNPRA